MPAAPKVLSNALSSNSPTTCGLMACLSNHWSRRARTAACGAGSSTGTLRSDCGKPCTAAACSAAGAYHARVDVPSAWLYTLRLGLAGAGRSASTTSSRCRARSPSKSSKPFSRHSRRRLVVCMTGCISCRTASLGRPSDIPTVSRTLGAATVPRSRWGNCSPS